MYRAIKLNKYKFSDIQITERLSVLQKVLSVLQKEICNTLQISLRNMKKFAMHCKFLEKVSYICSAFHF